MADDARSNSARTRCAQGPAPDAATGGIVPPIQPSTTFERDSDYGPGRIYARPDAPTLEPAERLLAELERGSHALLFASGMAACTAPFLALEPGDAVIAPAQMYWALRGWLAGWATRWGLRVTFVDTESNTDALEAALRAQPTRLVWLETPSNPSWGVTDLARAASLAHAHGALVAVDSTVSTPVLTQPLALGADLVVHAATKALNGHSDVLAGAVVCAQRDALAERIAQVRALHGAMLGPFEAWLLLRGMRTLPLRVRAASETALHLATHLARDERVAEVLYPGLPSHPQHAVARAQMHGGFGSMLSIRVRGGEEAASKVAARVELFRRATSLGGVESLLEHRARVEGPGSTVPRDLLRLSVGLEDPEELLTDLRGALG